MTFGEANKEDENPTKLQAIANLLNLYLKIVLNAMQYMPKIMVNLLNNETTIL